MTTNNPLVSVIIPCYNHEKYIAQCIQSVVSQTYTNMEIFVLDDGSKDSSFTIINALADKYGFFAESHENIGLSATLNKGIRQYAKGKYVCIVASDDYWEETKVEKQVAFYEQYPDFGFIFSRAHLVDDAGIVTGELHGELIQTCDFEHLIKGNLVPALTVMVKKEVFDHVGYFDEKCYIEDWDMWLRIADQYPFAYINERLAFYRMHGSNATHNRSKMLDAERYILAKWEELYPPAKPMREQHLLLEIADNCITNKKRAAQLIFPNMHLFFKYKSFRKSFRRLFLKFRKRK
ncbi:glycosyltransferase [Olivibacter sp. SDN3]|uniref:glycosyltransferase n=1 Tax=Olivibacter sp. SDN3 TaxID=2764720 RepID=UPI001651115B|nr:glycosyltransferase [Olivibacter sp. SDN3]QNL47741.1 glycosyltransferase [Olivibacter sp. SDN3]